MNERLTKRGADGQAMMDCQKCEADWTGKHGKPMEECTALYCRNRLLDRLVEYEDTGLTPEEIKELAHDTTGPLHRWIDAEAAGRIVVPQVKEIEFLPESWMDTPEKRKINELVYAVNELRKEEQK